VARRVDYAQRQRRDSCAAALAVASQLVDTMQDKCGELLGVTLSELNGNQLGDDMAERLRRSIDALRQSRSQLMEAANATHGIDVTVESETYESKPWLV
jgi:hypothetical protein